MSHLLGAAMPETSETMQDGRLLYRLGCPVWANDAWVGELYTSTQRRKWLSEYSSVFQAVEGNSTFYGLPSIETALRWADQAQDGFHFVLKFPREVSHEGVLDERKRYAEPFLKLLNAFADADRLGPAFLQLPPYFSGARLGELQRFLEWLPEEFAFAVEVRHDDFYSGSSIEDELNATLESRAVDRVLFDSRPLFSRPPSDEAETISQGRKPKLAYRDTVTAERPILRLIGRNSLEETRPWILAWAIRVAEWIRDGRMPYVFAHTPDDAFAPAMAAAFHDTLQAQLDGLEDLQPWPGRSAPKPPVQKQLF